MATRKITSGAADLIPPRASLGKLAPLVMATVHPSSLLRADDADRESEIARFNADLKTAAELLKRAHAA